MESWNIHCFGMENYLKMLRIENLIRLRDLKVDSLLFITHALRVNRNENNEAFGCLLAQLYANVFHQYFPHSPSLGLAKQSAITFDKSRRTNKEK